MSLDPRQGAQIEEYCLSDKHIAPQGHTVQLFSLRTGRQVTSPVTDYSYPRPISCLRFEERATEDVPDGPQSPGLLVGTGTAFDHWAWH